jgi:hypothetical protein
MRFKYFFIFLFLLTLFPAISYADITTGLVGRWAFDEGSGTTASDSAGSSNGTLVSGPTWVTGKIGSNAISFDGVNDKVSINNSSAIVPTEITLSVWVNPSQTASLKRILNKGATYYIRMTDGGGIQFIGSVFLSGGTISANTWSHVVVTGSATGHKIYINGVLSGSSATAYTPAGDNETLDIGGSLDFFSGSLDDVRIYNRALSLSDVSELYSYTGGVVTPSPVNGVCGSSNNVCTNGTLSDTTDTQSNYQWSCLGSNGGSTATCSIPIQQHQFFLLSLLPQSHHPLPTLLLPPTNLLILRLNTVSQRHTVLLLISTLL